MFSISVTPIVPYFLPPESAESSKELCAQLKSPIEDEKFSDIGGDFNANTTSSINEGLEKCFFTRETLPGYLRKG